MELKGSAVTVAEHVLFATQQNSAVFSASQNGILVFQTGGAEGANELLWFDRSGRQLGNVDIGQINAAHPRVSPDGGKIAVTSVDPASTARDIWLLDVERGARTRLTFSQSATDSVWAPDGYRLAYSSNTAAGADLLVKSVTGATAEQNLLHAPGMIRPWSWSRDGRYITYMYHATKTVTDRFDIWILPMFGDHKPFPFLQTNYDKDAPSFSPDGRWLAYTSLESGAPEVYVVSFPDAKTRLPVSSQGGFSPVWRGDGKELFYVAPGGQLMGVTVATNGASLRLGTPVFLFATEFTLSRGGNPFSQRQPFDVSAKDQRFMVTGVNEANREAVPLTLIVNWDVELKK